MTKRPVKLLPIWIAVSSVIILAGIILFALLGFNYSAERNARKTVEVEYDVVVVTDPTGVAMLKETCEDVFKKTGVSYSDFSQTVKIDANTGSETVGGKLVYTFSANLSDESLAAVKAGIDTRIIERTAEGILPVGADISVSVHELANYHFTDAAWRGAIAVAVGAVVALVYIHPFRGGLRIDRTHRLRPRRVPFAWTSRYFTHTRLLLCAHCCRRGGGVYVAFVVAHPVHENARQFQEPVVCVLFRG